MCVLAARSRDTCSCLDDVALYQTLKRSAETLRAELQEHEADTVNPGRPLLYEAAPCKKTVAAMQTTMLHETRPSPR